jgi:hypothetical protein
LSPEEIHGLESTLVDWAVADLRQVLFQIDQRLAVCELLRRLAHDPAVSERLMHDIVLSALWMFGSEYESAACCSNTTLHKIAAKLFGRPGARFVSESRRPDVIMKSEGYTCGAAQICGLPEDEFHCALPHRVLLVELKRSGSVVSRKDLSQADGYAQALHEARVMPDSYFVNVWVVGGEVGPGVGTDRFLADGRRCYARVRATTFAALARVAIHNMRPLNGWRLGFSDLSTEVLLARVAVRTS